MRINFRNYKELSALSLDRFADDFLCSAVTVHLCSVDQAHPKLDSQTEGHFPGAGDSAFSHPPRALAKCGDKLAIGQCDRSHLNSIESEKAGSRKDTARVRKCHIVFPATLRIL